MATNDPEELTKHGVTDALVAYVMANLTYSTFRCAHRLMHAGLTC